MKPKISLADLFRMAGVAGSGLITAIGFIVWLTRVEAHISTVADAQAELKAQVFSEKSIHAKADGDVLDQLRDMNTRLSRMEGTQTAILREVKNGP